MERANGVPPAPILILGLSPVKARPDYHTFRADPRTFSAVQSLPGGLSLLGELAVRQVEEYELRAQECRTRAAHMKDPEHKRQLEDMAHAWELLARARLKHLRNGWDKPPPME